MTYIPATWNISELVQGIYQAPIYHSLFEVLLIIWIIRLLFVKSSKPHRSELSEQEKEELIQEWKPQPLVPDTPEDDPGLQAFIGNNVTSKIAKLVTINGEEYLNMASMNFLNMIGDQDIENAAVQCIGKYGVGSCGPRGFYGTVDVHLELEEELARFMECEEAALYSYGFATIASAIPAYSKRTDVIFCDEGVSFAIQKGLQASRSKLMFFKHNDMDDLERLLKEQERDDIKIPKKAGATRRFLVVEGLYVNFGDICPLKKLVDFKYKYKVRLFIDESISFGVLGATGKGVTEHFGVDVNDIDLITASLEYSLGSIGGFAIGSKFVVDHQRLSGLGYCFSASLPPMLAVAAKEALHKMENNPSILENLRQKCQSLYDQLANLNGLEITGDSMSPILHLRLAKPCQERKDSLAKLQQIVDKVRESSVILTVARYLDQEELFLPPPSVRLAVNCDLSDSEVGKVVEGLKRACHEVFA
ncbi:serine palmitoyltransferase 1-like [Lineus longissimus]|uniref:serine palmitoyltransferase 1-like n=1 Tax=Lineus longissimus TaxID=88925 RepID=UPI002B4EDADF